MIGLSKLWGNLNCNLTSINATDPIEQRRIGAGRRATGTHSGRGSSAEKRAAQGA